VVKPGDLIVKANERVMNAGAILDELSGPHDLLRVIVRRQDVSTQKRHSKGHHHHHPQGTPKGEGKPLRLTTEGEDGNGLKLPSPKAHH
jgi:hypothetical protein